MHTVQKTTLSNGLTIVSEHVDSVKSLSIGIWVKTGSRNEHIEQAGITHFLEHMLFKGTKKRNHFQIAQSLERVGGYLNAFTSNEHTCYYARCLDTQLELAVDVLSDLVLDPIFPEDELVKEKKVVLEELKMYKDQPDDFLFEHFVGDLFKGHPLGRPIIGFEHSIKSYTRQQLFDYMETYYQPWNLTVAAAG
ncbi:pitrilysin family protein, partial [Arthrospira platensis SPKY1]|nr:pitrilysin family protein [Arthrospira platensis SPKY1]